MTIPRSKGILGAVGANQSNDWKIQEYNTEAQNKMNTKSRENKVRQQLEDQGYALDKHINRIDPYHSGCYRILDGHTGNIEAGANFDMTLEDVERFAAE